MLAVHWVGAWEVQRLLRSSLLGNDGCTVHLDAYILQQALFVERRSDRGDLIISGLPGVEGDQIKWVAVLQGTQRVTNLLSGLVHAVQCSHRGSDDSWTKLSVTIHGSGARQTTSFIAP
jgi:hypothetical protein